MTRAGAGRDYVAGHHLFDFRPRPARREHFDEVEGERG